MTRRAHLLFARVYLLMSKIFYGCDEISRGWERYFQLCNALEVRLDPQVTPTLKTLNRWRVDSPKNFCFMLHVAPELIDALLVQAGRKSSTLSPELQAAWEKTMEQARALAARALVIETPTELSPNATNRALMVELAKLAQASKLPLIWQAQGMWSKSETRDFAESHGMIFALDPFLWQQEELSFTSGDACFILSERIGMRRKFDQYDLEELVGWSQSYNRVFVLLRGRFKWDHARELRYLIDYA